MALVQIKVPYREGYDYGIGAGVSIGDPRGLVASGKISGVENAFGAVAKISVARITTTEQLEQSLGIDAEANYGCAAFGAGVSARFSFARDTKIQSSSLFFVVNASVQLAFEQIDDPILTDPASLIAAQYDNFVERYGNMFVRGIGRGGIFAGILQVEASSAEVATKISADLSGTYGLFSAEASMKFADVSRQANGQVFCSMYHEGGPVELGMRDPTNPSELLENANRFLASFRDDPKANSVPYFVTLAPMSIARGPLPPNVADIEHAQDIVMFCAKERSRILDKLNMINYVLSNQYKYLFGGDITVEAFNAASANFQADLDEIAACASAALKTPAGAKMPALHAADKGQSYPIGVLPSPMPALKEGKATTVPNVSGCDDWEQIAALITAARLVPNSQVAPGPVGDFGIISVTPPPGTPVQEGNIVTVVLKPEKLRLRLLPGFRIRLENPAFKLPLKQ